MENEEEKPTPNEPEPKITSQSSRKLRIEYDSGKVTEGGHAIGMRLALWLKRSRAAGRGLFVWCRKWAIRLAIVGLAIGLPLVLVSVWAERKEAQSRQADVNRLKTLKTWPTQRLPHYPTLGAFVQTRMHDYGSYRSMGLEFRLVIRPDTRPRPEELGGSRASGATNREPVKPESPKARNSFDSSSAPPWIDFQPLSEERGTLWAFSRTLSSFPRNQSWLGNPYNRGTVDADVAPLVIRFMDKENFPALEIGVAPKGTELLGENNEVEALVFEGEVQNVGTDTFESCVGLNITSRVE